MSALDAGSFTLARANAQQNETRSALRRLFGALSDEEREIIDPTDPNHLTYMVILLMKRLGCVFPDIKGPAENEFQSRLCYDNIVSQSAKLGINPTWNTSKVFSLKGDLGFVGFANELLKKVAEL
jgi:hypothetical protein